jgi:hypothetical protein
MILTSSMIKSYLSSGEIFIGTDKNSKKAPRKWILKPLLLMHQF